MSKPGYVYALINPSMPGLVKVGRTERDPTIRVSELSPCEAMVGGDPIKDAVKFFRFRTEHMDDCLLRGILDIQKDEYGLYNDFRGVTRPARIAAQEGALKWLREL